MSLLFNTLARGVQLFTKPKKSPETLKILLNQLMLERQQHKHDKESSEYGSRASHSSRDRIRPLTGSRRHSNEHAHHGEFSPYYYPPVPQYRQIKKQSRFQRLCCPCLRRNRRRRQPQRLIREPYRPYVVPEEYFHRLDHLKQMGTVPPTLCHRHSMHYPVDSETQTDLASPRRSVDQTASETPFLGRRRSSVRFEDEVPAALRTKEPTAAPVPEQPEPSTAPTNDGELQRNVSFRNNEDDLWTTVTIDTKQSTPIQSSHFNRLAIENLSCINTSISNNDNGVTAIHISSPRSESPPADIPLPPPASSLHAARNRSKPPPPPPPFPQMLVKSTRTRYKPPPSRTLTTSSEDDTDLRHIKPVEEINTLVADKYSYNDVSQALKSNVERLKNTFIHAQETQSHYDKPKIIRPTAPPQPYSPANGSRHSSDC